MISQTQIESLCATLPIHTQKHRARKHKITPQVEKTWVKAQVPGAGLQQLSPSCAAGFLLLQLWTELPTSHGHAPHTTVPAPKAWGEISPAAGLWAGAPRRPLRRFAVFSDDTGLGGQRDSILHTKAEIRTKQKKNWVGYPYKISTFFQPKPPVILSKLPYDKKMVSN